MTMIYGFGAPSTFGGVIPTPTLDRSAARGLVVHELPHDVAMLATRAALLTGTQPPFGRFRRHRQLVPGFRANSVMGPESATVARILKDDGYRTSWYGKKPQHAGVDQPPGRSTSGRPAWVSTTSARVQRRRRQPVEPMPRQDHAMTFVGEPGWNLIYGDGRRGHRLDARARRDRPVAAVLNRYAPGATHSPHSPEHWSGRARSAPCTSTRATRRSASRSSPTRSGSA